jgi:hypothetical protein
MVEAISSLTLAQRQAQAVRVLAMYAAKQEIKEQIRREGRVKLSKVPHRHIQRLARDRLMADASYRAELVAEAKLIVEEWTAEGFFGRRAAMATPGYIGPLEDKRALARPSA